MYVPSVQHGHSPICLRMQHTLCIQGIGVSHLTALAALPQLKVLELCLMHCWAEDAVRLGLGWLVAKLLCVRVLNVPSEVLVRHYSSRYRWCVCFRKSVLTPAEVMVSPSM